MSSILCLLAITGPQEAAFPRRFAPIEERRLPENVKWLRVLRVALRNQALSRSKKHDGGSSAFWQVYFHRRGGDSDDGTRCPRTVRALAEVSPCRHQITLFDAFPTFYLTTILQGSLGAISAQWPFPETCYSSPSSQV